MSEHDGHNTRLAHVLIAACRYVLSQETYEDMEHDIIMETMLQWESMSPVHQEMLLADIECAIKDNPCSYLSGAWEPITRRRDITYCHI